MALDYFHAYFISDSTSVSQILSEIQFRPIGYLDTLEEIYPIKLVYWGLRLNIFKRDDGRFYIDIDGSFHKFYNKIRFDKEQNFDDFTYSQQQDALLLLSEKLNCNLENMRIKSFEFGVNINCINQPNRLINTMYCYDKRIAASEKRYNNNGTQIIFKRDSYCIKIYNKSQESKLYKHKALVKVKDILRLEIKYLDKNYCNKGGHIYTIADFHDKSKLEFLYDELKKHWDKILMYKSTIAPIDISKGDLKWFNKCNTPNYFADPNGENFKNVNQTRCNHYNRFIEVLDKFDYRSQCHELTQRIANKCQFLLSDDNKLIEALMFEVFKLVSNAKRIEFSSLIEDLKILLPLRDDHSDITRDYINCALYRLEKAGHIQKIEDKTTYYDIV